VARNRQRGELVPTAIIGTDKFRSEAQRRLVDAWDMMIAFDLRSRQSVMDRVKAGTLPEPLIVKANTVSLWDADAVEAMTGTHVTPTDRKES
jgi:hypothetical protein